MTGSLAFRKNEAAILRGDVPEKYTRMLPFIPGETVLELGSAEGVLACLLARADLGNKPSVIALERSEERHAAAQRLYETWRSRYRFDGLMRLCLGDIRQRLELLDGVDTVVAVRMVYYLRDDLDPVFAQIAGKVANVVLCGNRNRAAWWRQGIPDKPDGPVNYYAAPEGMRALLERHGYLIAREELGGDAIVVGHRG